MWVDDARRARRVGVASIQGDAMKADRRQFVRLAGATAALVALSPRARAQAYPSRPLRWVVGFPAGGGADIVSRIMAPWLSERLGQPVIVENKPGASSNISIQAVVNSPPDGYTLLFVPASAAVNVTLFETLPFNLLRDIAPVSGLIDFPLVMVANPVASGQERSPSSSPTPRPIRARSAWPRSAPARPRMWRASCSR